MFNPFSRKNTSQNPNRIASTIGSSGASNTSSGNTYAAEPVGALAYSSAALKSKNTARASTTSPDSFSTSNAAGAGAGAAAPATSAPDAMPSTYRGSVIDGNEVSRRTSTKGRSGSIFGYIFGGEIVTSSSKTDDGERGSEMVAKGALEEVYIDLNQQLVPDGMRVLNLPKEDGVNRHVSKKPITGNE